MFTLLRSQFSLRSPFTVHSAAAFNGKLSSTLRDEPSGSDSNEKTENALKTVNRELKTVTQGVADA